MAENPPRIRAARRDKAEGRFVKRLAAEVFSRFGDYDRTLPVWMKLPEIETVFACVDDRPVAFAMYGAKVGEPAVVDLLAIAVEPAWQARGVGRLLLEHCESAACKREASAEPAIEVTVAEDNTKARRLFEGSGYRRVAGEEGEYPGGQRSLTLLKRLKRLS